MLSAASTNAETVRLHAAGSLRAALTEIVRDFESSNSGQHQVEAIFGASGLLREKIEAGEPAHVFASADTGHPKKLADQGRAVGPVVIFARNQLCALVRAGLEVKSETLLDVMLNPKTRVGISTPKADPSGDYAFALFAKADAMKPGARAALEAKALQLAGGLTSPKAPEGKTLYGWLMATDQADLFLTYCTNAIQAKAEVPALSVVSIPKSINVGADYGLVVLNGAPTAASGLADHVRSSRGQAILSRHGFGAGD